ncbi:MAG: DUF1330 domain-containing protein [Propionibacteriales bacterium]|nr:DUF1330 domain-containing protein [Propionibacteriales bacterium]
MTHDYPVDPTRDQFAALQAEAETSDGPVQMLNLLAFGADGAAGYLTYVEAIRPHLDRAGATITYAGDRGQVVIGDDGAGWWDAVIIVRYPSRQAFIAMVKDPDYQGITAHRTGALVRAHLVATDPWPA